MIYFVSGPKRSGTSAMMACLITGGVDAVWSEAREEINKKFSDKDFALNPCLYEPSRDQVSSPTFREDCDGKTIKLVVPASFNSGQQGNHYNILQKAREGDAVIFMMRDYGEVAKSTERAGLGPMRMRRHTWEETMVGYMNSLAEIGCRVTPVWFCGLLQSPQYMLRLIAAMDWPIDPVAAAKAVRPELCRFAA